MRLVIRLHRMAASGDLLRDVLEDDREARLLCTENGEIVVANETARSLWPDLEPIRDLRRRLYDPRRLPGPEDGDSRLDRLAGAAAAGFTEHVTVPLRPMAEGFPVGAGDVAAREWPFALEEPEWWDITVRRVAAPGARGRRGEGGSHRLWVGRDVTAQRAIDEVLARERESLADLLFYLPVGLYSVDANGSLRFVNQRMARWLDRDPAALRGTPLVEVVDGSLPPPEDGDWRGEMRFLTADGHRFSALVSQAAYDEAGELFTQAVVMREAVDATAVGREQADGAPGSWRWDRMFRWLFDGAPVGIALTDPEGRLTDCNRALVSLLRQRRDDLLDQSLIALVSEGDRPAVADAMARLLSGVEVGGMHFDITLDAGGGAAAGRGTGGARGRPPQGPSGPVTAALFLGPMGGKEGADVEGVIAHVIDTSEQRSLERQFAQAQKMQAMGQLAGGVAHDFNNLLTAMIGYSDLLLQRHGTGDPSFADIMQIRQNANRAANLVRQLLAFSRRQPLRPRPLDVGAALSELSHLLRRLLGEAIQLRLVHGRDVDRVRVDPGQFDQVIINLAVNARDAMPDGGALTISTRLATLDAPIDRGAETMPPGPYVVIEVRDTGKGISEENLSRIFEPFFTTKGGGAVGAGTGLGLSTVYGILRQTGGFIDVASTPGEGTTFSISLPSEPIAEVVEARAETGAPPAPQDESAESSPAPAVEDLTGAGTILLVEDEVPVRLFAARALRNKGYSVIEAGTGEAALDVLEDQPSLVLLITDMVMPGIDGATLARRVRESRPDLPVIITSGYSEDAARGDILEQPAIHFLPKPFSLKLLAETVKDILAGRTSGRTPDPDAGA
ncbi:response regulator [Roseospira navarrensis]|uniref:histidine kinase n=2 Tax=Roseospira navarrensis TaxID=140058 RepID=A0A7X1ZAY3_9PROT|nr:response regulator [Roseospira navarrensis]